MTTSRISLLSMDYDGTLSKIEQDREESRPSPALEKVLREITSKAKLAIVTSKAFDFVSSRIPYANSWGCVSGLDLRFDDGAEFVVSPPVAMEKELAKARALVGNGVHYEEKRGPESLLLGFAIDWRGKSEPRDLDKVVKTMKRDGVYVLHEAANPFVDFYCAKPDKGAAVSHIKKEFGLSKGTMVLGDSRADNGAFREGDVTIGVDHGQDLGRLDCEFVLEQEGVPRFLRALYEGDMAFSPDLPGLERKRELDEDA